MREWEEVHRVAYSVAHKMAIKGDNVDELVNEIFIAGRWQDGEIEFVRNAMVWSVMAWRQKGKNPRLKREKDIEMAKNAIWPLSLSTENYANENEEPMGMYAIMIQNAMATDDQGIKDVDTKDFIDFLLKHLPNDCIFIIIARDVYGWSFTEVAEKLKSNRETVRQKHHKGIEILRRIGRDELNDYRAKAKH